MRLLSLICSLHTRDQSRPQDEVVEDAQNENNPHQSEFDGQGRPRAGASQMCSFLHTYAYNKPAGVERAHTFP